MAWFEEQGIAVSERSPRKLAVILHADVADSTALVQLDETLAHERIRDAFGRFSELTRRYGGVAHEVRGDALVAEFARASDAVSAALAFQAENRAHNRTLSDDIRPEIRIGISLGEVVISDGTVTGAGVILAQRLERLAEPGGVVVQASVADTVPTRLPFTYDNRGEHALKGFERRVAALAVYLEKGAAVPEPEAHGVAAAVFATAHPTERSTVNLPERPAIAVLPFTNLSGDPEQEYFSDGITEDIITGLSYWRWFPVIARNSTFAYKGKAVDVTRVARDLGARYVVEGSVRRARDRVRIAAQLIDASTGYHLWAQRYDRDVTDVFAIQDEIAERIVTSIEPQLTRAEQSRASRKHPKSLDAWDYTLRALAEQTKMTKKGHAEAQALLDKAIRSDPTCSYAFSLLSLCQYHEAIFGWSDDRTRSLAASHASAGRAVSNDEGDWLASAMLGLTYLWAKREYELAVSEARRSVGLNPSAALAYHFLACVLEFSGDSANAIPNLHSILKLDPYYRFASVAFSDLALSHLSLKEFERSAEYANRAVRVMPGNVRAYERMASSLGHLGRTGEARAALKKVTEMQPSVSVAALDETYPFKDPRQRALFLDGLRMAGLTG